MSEQSEVEHLIALYAERVAMSKAMANHERPTGAMAQAVMDKGAELDAACEDFRRRFYPRSGRVFVGLYSVLVASPAGRRHRTILDRFDAYVTTAKVAGV